MKKAVKKTPEKQPVWGSSAKRDQYTVVLEDLRSQFKAFGENLALTREVFSRDLAEIKSEILKIKAEILKITSEILKINERITALEVRVARLEQANLELLREIRQNTVSRSEFEQLREHVRKLEARIT